MERSREGLEDLISRRLINQAQTGNDVLVTSIGGGEARSPFEGPVEPAADDNETDPDGAAAPADSESNDTAVAHTAGLPATTFTKIEKSLANLGFFTPSSRRLKEQKVKHMSFTREVDGKRVEVTADIVPSAIFGLPVTADQDKYLALQKIITDLLQSDGKIENPIRFKSADLLRLLDRNTKTGKNYKEVSEWLDVMSSTTIISEGVVYMAGKKRFARDRFRVFDRAVSFGKEMDDGSIADANYVWLSSWQLENINNKYLLPIDLDTYQQLKNHIAKALVPLLQIWLYASHKAGSLSFEKRYDELCEILNVQKYKAPSQILRQFKPSLDELTTHEYLEKWRIEKTTDRKAYKIILFHGPKFHRDRRKRSEQKSLTTDIPLVIAESDTREPSLPEPGKIEAPLTKPELKQKVRRTKGVAVDPAPPQPSPTSQHNEKDIGPELVDQLAARGIMPSVAIKLLVSVQPRIEQVPDYIEYWDFVRAGKDVGPGFLHDLIKNGDALPSNFETSRQRAARKAADEKRERFAMAKQTLEFAYDEYRREAVTRFVSETVPTDELERRIAEKTTQLRSQPTFWDKMQRPELTRQMAEYEVRGEIAKQAPLLSFDEFCRKEGPRILADYGIDPAELGIAGSGSPTDTPTGANQQRA